MVHFPAQPPHYIRALGLEPAAHPGPLRENRKGKRSMLSAQWRSQQPVGCGLQNLGNSCYLNSVLQCLAHLPPLANIALAQERECKCPTGKCVCCTIDRQICSMLQHRGGGAVAPTVIHNNLHVLSRSFVRGRQEDAHELLRCLVDAMERAALRHAGNYNPQKPPRQPRTLVNHIFGGILQSQVRCLLCSHVSATWDPCMDLSLELGGCSTVEEALRRFTAVERLDGDNKYRCEGCKQLVAANKHMNIYDDPNVLVIHLKRFDGIFGAKISRDIAFGTQLNLEPFMCPSRRYKPAADASSGGANGAGSSSSSSSSTWLNGRAGSSSSSTGSHCSGGSLGSNGNNNCHANGSSSGSPANGLQQQQQRQDVRTSKGEYTLHGVVIHSGFSAHSGHYYAYVRDWDDKWHCMNDSQVYRVSEATVLKQQVYMLFYVRSSIKRLAQLPRHVEADPGQPAAAAGVKRSISNSAAEAGVAAAAARMIGPQLPPHVAKRQRLSQDGSESQQQQQQHGPAVQTAAAAAVGAEPADMFAAEKEDRVFGPQPPPGWHKPKSSSGGGGGGGHSGTAALTAAGPEQQQQFDAHGSLPGQGSKAAVSPTVIAGAGCADGPGSAAAQVYFGWAQQQQQQQPAQLVQQQGQQQQQEQQQQQQQHTHHQQQQQQHTHHQQQQQHKHHHHQQQQQQQSASAVEQLLSSAKPAMQRDVEQHMSSCRHELRCWLLGSLAEATSSGKSYEQFERETKPLWRKHPLLRSLGLQLMATWHSKLLSSRGEAVPAAGGGDAAAAALHS